MDVVGGGVLNPALDEVVEVAVDVGLGGNATAPVDLVGGGRVEVVGAEGVAAAVGGSADLGRRVGVVHLGLGGADTNAAAAAAVSAEEVELVPSVGGEAADGLALVAAAHVLVLGAEGAVHVEVRDIVGVDLGRDGVVASGHPDVTEDPGTLDLTPAAVGAVVRVLQDVVGGGVLNPALDEVVEVAVDVGLGGNATAPVDLVGIGRVEVVGAEGVAAAVGGSANLSTGVGVVHLGLDGADTNAAAAAAVSAEEVELVPSVGGEAANGL